MNKKHREIRALLEVMSPNRATAFIMAFHLPKDEENVLLLKEVERQSYTQIASMLGMSPETIKRNRRRAFQKITDELENL